MKARLALPSLAWFALFIFIPLLLVLRLSLAERGTYGGIEWTWSAVNYARLFAPEMVWILAQSVILAGVTATACVILGVLAAWSMSAMPLRRRTRWLALIALPFLTNGLVRVLGVKSLLGMDGPVQVILRGLSIPHDPFWLTANPLLVFYGMIAAYLPFAVLPLYGALEKFDFMLVEAAQDLGAGPWRVLIDVLLPNLRPALAGAFALVFIPCLGEYVIPDLLGGAKTMLLGNLITEQFLRARDWPFGAAVSMVLILPLVALWGLRSRRRADAR